MSNGLSSYVTTTTSSNIETVIPFINSDAIGEYDANSRIDKELTNVGEGVKNRDEELEKMFTYLNLTLALDKNQKCMKTSEKLICMYYIALTFNLTDPINIETVQATINPSIIGRWIEEIKNSHYDLPINILISVSAGLSAIGLFIVLNICQHSCKRLIGRSDKYKIVHADPCTCENLNKLN